MKILIYDNFLFIIIGQYALTFTFFSYYVQNFKQNFIIHTMRILY